MWGTLIGLAALERFDVVSCDRLTAHAPVAAGDLVDHAAGELAHVLTLDLDHRVGETLDDLPLLLGGEDALDHFYLDQRHAVLLRRTGRCARQWSVPGSCRTSGTSPDIDPRTVPATPRPPVERLLP